jgi:hypothetical protein
LLLGEDATVFWATGKGSMARFSCRDAKRAVVCLADRAASVSSGKRGREVAYWKLYDAVAGLLPGHAGGAEAA